MTSTYWKTVGACVDAAMKTDPTIKSSFLGPNEETDIEGQIRIIESAISSKVGAIAVAPSQADQVQPTLEKAVAAGIPVILIDTDIANFTNKSAFVGTDNKLGGQLGGEFIAKALQAGDEVAIIRGAAGDPVHNQREQGAKEAMEKAGLKVVDVQAADSLRDKGQTVAENLLTANPNLKEELTIGNIWLAHGYSNDMFHAQQDAKHAGRPFSIAYATPKEGAVLALDSIVLHKSGPRPDLAHRFIDFMLEGRNSAELTNFIGSGNPNRDALQYIEPAIAANQAVFPPPAIRRRLEMLRDLDRIQRCVLSRMWTEIKVR